jgi:hypothetical protein
MVQRNLTPGGDKNGADINLALDALEMAFTRNHINAFVIVGGDSDFMALVEKLKQYDKKVIVVGGRAFTSIILQKNCHEFIAYENLIPQQPARRPAERARTPGAPAASGDGDITKAIPLIRRALKVLTDREVSPQLGLLKSTLLQLDSTFTERDYRASTFRDFIEKVAAAGYVNLKQVDRSLLVELADKESPEVHEESGQPVTEASAPAPVRQQPQHQAHHQAASRHAGHPQQDPAEHPGPPPTPLTPEQIDEGVRAFLEVFQNARSTPHWPMYLRNVKNFIKNVAPSFDERKYGFVNFLEAVRACGRAGLFRLERNRQGILRIFAGPQFPHRGVGDAAGVAEPPQLLDVANDVSSDVEGVEAATEILEPIEVNGSTSSMEVPESLQGEGAEASEEATAEEVEVVAAPKRRARASSGSSTKRKPAAPRRKKKTTDSD